MKAPGRDRIYFLPKDPHWTFIWWNITQETIGAIGARGEFEPAEAKLTLRVHDVTDIIFDGSNSHHTFDVEVTIETDHWFLNIWASNRNYCVEVGFKTGEGKFYPVVRSNTLCLPRDCPSDSTGGSWSTIDI